MNFVVIGYSSPGRLTQLANPETSVLNLYMIFSLKGDQGMVVSRNRKSGEVGGRLQYRGEIWEGRGRTYSQLSGLHIVMSTVIG